MAPLVFQLIPGPGTLAILNATARHGSRAGMAAVFGTLLGIVLREIKRKLTLAPRESPSAITHLNTLLERAERIYR